MNEPKFITKGTTVKWSESFADYPADEWALTYSLRGAGTGLQVSGTADGTNFDITLTVANTNVLAVGDYKYQATVSKSGEVYLVSEGVFTVKAGLAAIDTATTVETRSANRIILDKIRAMISGATDRNVQEYTIDNRQLKHYTLTELIKLEQYYAQKVSQEVDNGNGRKSPFLRPRAFYHVRD